MAFTVYVEKKPDLAHEANGLTYGIRTALGISSLARLRVVNRYEVESISRELFLRAVRTVLSEPQLDTVSDTLDAEGATVLVAEHRAGRFHRRAEWAEQCIRILSCEACPTVRASKMYLLYGDLTEEEISRIEAYAVCDGSDPTHPEEERDLPPIDSPDARVTGFATFDADTLANVLAPLKLHMTAEELSACRDYFAAEQRDPTVWELLTVAAYRTVSRRGTLALDPDGVKIPSSRERAVWEQICAARQSDGAPIRLQDLATVPAPDGRDADSRTVPVTVRTQAGTEDWCLLPDSGVPLGGGLPDAVRGLLSRRAYVYATMHVVGANPDGVRPKGVDANASYSNELGLVTGLYDEISHPSDPDGRMEASLVLAAAPAAHLADRVPTEGDLIVVLGGAPLRGSKTSPAALFSASAEEEAIPHAGNAPEERKLQRLFRDPRAARLIKRSHAMTRDGVAVCAGSLAEGVILRLDNLPTPSHEQVVAVVSRSELDEFTRLANLENLAATVVGEVQSAPRLTVYRNGTVPVDLARDFLTAPTRPSTITASLTPPVKVQRPVPHTFAAGYRALLTDPAVSSKRERNERFDASNGAVTVLTPYGGRYRMSPIQAAVHKLPVEGSETSTCTFSAWGYNPYINERSPYHGGYLAVVEALTKLVATGASPDGVTLSLRAHFDALDQGDDRRGRAVSTLLGAYEAQRALGISSLGRHPVTASHADTDGASFAVAFAVASGEVGQVISPEFKGVGHRVVWVRPAYDGDGLPDPASQNAVNRTVCALMREGKVFSARTPTYGGVAEGVYKMCIGNLVGFRYAEGLTVEEIFGYAYGSYILEVEEGTEIGTLLGYTTAEGVIRLGDEVLTLTHLTRLYEGQANDGYSRFVSLAEGAIPTFAYEAKTRPSPAIATARPHVLIPVFPGTNCECDVAKAFLDAGAEPRIEVVNNLTPEGILQSVYRMANAIREAEMIFIPGGFSGADQPDGSAKFITAFFRGDAVKEAVTDLLDRRGGLMAGICNGFQALIKLGLVPFGKIIDTDESCPTLTYNRIGRHQSMLVRTRIASNLSPWLSHTRVGDIYTVPVSHGEGRFLCEPTLLSQLVSRGQIATQYVDEEGRATSDVRFNPNGSFCAIEGITSPDGRVLGKMGHTERVGNGLYRNAEGVYDREMFLSAVRYFKQ